MSVQEGVGGEDPRKVPKIVIPKIVLKLGHAAGEAQLGGAAAGLRAEGAEALVRACAGEREPFVGLRTLVLKVNYAAYRAVESLLEV